MGYEDLKGEQKNASQNKIEEDRNRQHSCDKFLDEIDDMKIETLFSIKPEQNIAQCSRCRIGLHITRKVALMPPATEEERAWAKKIHDSMSFEKIISKASGKDIKES